MVRIFDKNVSKLLLPFLLNTSNKECCDLTMIFKENWNEFFAWKLPRFTHSLILHYAFNSWMKKTFAETTIAFGSTGLNCLTIMQKLMLWSPCILSTCQYIDFRMAATCTHACFDQKNVGRSSPWYQSLLLFPFYPLQFFMWTFPAQKVI